MPPVVSPATVGPPEAERTGRTRRRRPSGRHVAALLVPAVLLPLSLALWLSRGDAPQPLTRADVNSAVDRAIEESQQAQRNAPPDSANAYRTIAPSLVTVTSGSVDGRVPGAGRDVALGTGVVINAQGAVITALHVVDDGGPIRVRFADGTESAARIAARERDKDIAVLAAEELPAVVVPAVLGGSPDVGDAVFAVGNPFGLQASLTAGVVSANDRSVSTHEGGSLDDLIQFDAAVNPGNSGGPLLNRDGQVVGIVTGLANPSRQAYFVGIGFAVPINVAGGAAGGPEQ